EQVSTFFGAPNTGSQCIVPVAHIQLIVAPIAKLRCRIGGVAERPVEVTGEFRAVTHHRHEIKTVLVELVTNARHAAVHHIAGTDAVGSGFGEGHRRAGQFLEGGFYLYAAVVENRTVPVRGVRTQAGINPKAEAVAK